MARPTDITETVIQATFRLVAEMGWRRLTTHDIAAEAGVALSELHAAFPSKQRILGAFLRRIDAAVLAGGDASDADDPPRDRMFDVIMRRLDALTPFKAAIARMRGEAIRHPSDLACVAPKLLVSMAWMLEAAGIGSSGVAGAVRTKVLAGVYLTVLDVWLSDDSPDMAATMAAVDKQLGRVETAVRTVERACPRRADAASQE